MAELNLATPPGVSTQLDEAKEGPIDATVDIITPENISFNYQVAGPFRRFPAFVLDFVIRVVVCIVLFLIGLFLLWFLAQFAALAGSVEAIRGMIAMWVAIGVVTWFLLNWFYGGLFETFMNGRTPGKWVMGIRVLTDEGKPINGMQAVMRNIFRFADTMPFLSMQIFDPNAAALMVIPTYMLGLIVMSTNRRFQRIGDLVCGTMVVIEERSWLMGVARVEDPRTAQLASLLPPKFEVSRSLARALATYVERRRFFSQARRREIARHLGEPLLRMFGMPADTSHDLLLCALYYRTFIADRGDDDHQIAAAFAQHPHQPFGQVPPEIVYQPPPLPQQHMVGTDPFFLRR